MAKDLLAERRSVELSIDRINRQITAILRKSKPSDERALALSQLKTQKEALTQKLCMINRNMVQIKLARTEYVSKNYSLK